MHIVHVVEWSAAAVYMAGDLRWRITLIITRTPYRVSLFGGGTDFPAWYLKHGGKVVGFSISRYAYLTVRLLPPFFEHKHRVVYSCVETVNSIDEIQHPAVRAVLSDQRIETGLEIHHDGDLPARSGLGSSSSFTVGLLHAIHTLQGRKISKQALAGEATRIEQDIIGEAVGSQDQCWAAHGGFNSITFQPDGRVVVKPATLSRTRSSILLNHLMLFFTGLCRLAPAIEAEKMANIERRIVDLREIGALTDEAIAILEGNGDLAPLGDLLHESWRVKKGLATQVTSVSIDEIYDRARSAGATGGKLLGAGGGGFMLLFAPPERQAAIRTALEGLIEVDFGIDYSGSSVIFDEPEQLSRCNARTVDVLNDVGSLRRGSDSILAER